MTPEEELELPPWEKFSRYGLFPYKMCLHFLLIGLVTSLVIIANLSYASYSRAVWLSAANILFPTDYARWQTDLSTPYQYYIYTRNQTIVDGNRILYQYFRLANESLDDITIYSSSSDSTSLASPNSSNNNSNASHNLVDSNHIPIPFVLVHSQSSPHSQRYNIQNASSIGTAWPLGYTNLLPQQSAGGNNSSSRQEKTNLRLFFNNLIKLDYNLYFRSSSGNNKDYLWKWGVTYSAATAGRILVTAQVNAVENYAPLAKSSTFWVLSLLSLLAASVYWVLLMKALVRQLRLLAKLLPANRRHRKSTTPAIDSDNASVVFRYGGVSQQTNTSTGRQREASLSMVVSDRGNDDDDEDDNNPLLLATAPTSTQNAVPPASASCAVGVDNPGSREGGQRSHSQRSRSQHLFSLSSQLVQTQLQSASLSLLDLQSAIESLTWTERLSVVNLWVLAATMACVVITVYGGIAVMSSHSDPLVSDALKALLGVGCLLIWFASLQFLEFFPRYYILIAMLKRTVPRVSQFLLGVLPVFVGYALLGLVCFGDSSERFGDLSQTLRTLFAVVNGDIIYDTFGAVEAAGLGGQLYVYLYILLFTYVVLMTIIAIVEEAFFAAQEQNHRNQTDSPEDRSPDHSQHPGEGEAKGDAEITGLEILSRASFLDPSMPSPPRQQPPLSRGNSLNPAFNSSSLSRSTSLRGEEGDGGGSSKRELPEKVKVLLRHVRVINSNITSSSGEERK